MEPQVVRDPVHSLQGTMHNSNDNHSVTLPYLPYEPTIPGLKLGKGSTISVSYTQMYYVHVHLSLWSTAKF